MPASEKSWRSPPDYYLHVTGELDKAAQTYQETIESYPRDLPSYGNLGSVFAAQGQYEKATEAMKQGLRLAPDRLALYANLANCHSCLAAL